MTANMATAELLADLRIDPNAHPRDWQHFDGRPATDAEVDTIMTSTPDDLEAAALLVQLRAMDAQRDMDALAEMERIITPYFAAGPHGRTVGEIVPTMNEPDRSRFLELAQGIDPSTGTWRPA